MKNNMISAYTMRQLTAKIKLNIYNDNVKQLYSNICESAKKGRDEYIIPDDIARNLNFKYNKESTCQIYKELKSLGYDIHISGLSSPHSIWISWK
jgi:hypothetical protein